MTPEDIAARYNKLPGFRLVDYHSVALPLWLITFDALVISEKKHPVVDEFLLRAIERGVATVPELAGFLGLSEKLILRRLGTLVGSDLVTSQPGADRTAATLKLTLKGTNVVRDAAKSPPRREKLVLAYDAIARQPITGRIAREAMRTPQQIKQFGLFELPALPGRAPDDEELSKIDYNTALPKETRKDQKIHQVLSAQKLGSVARRYREGLMLIYRGATDLEQVAVRFFSIDGRPMPEVDRGFQQNRGLQRLTIIEQLKKHRTELEKELMSDSDYRAVVEFSSQHAPASDVSDKIAQAAKLESTIQEKEKQIEETKQPPSEIEALKTEIERLRAEKAAAEELIAQNQSRFLEPQEHPKLFEQALKEVKKRLLIISPWISDRIMEPKVRFIEAALRRGVEVYIGYGISERENDERKARQGDLTIEWLIDTASVYPKLHVVKLGDTHAKVLLMDDRFVAVGSFNWMSFGGLPSYENGVQVIREELSILNTAPNMIEQMFQRYLARFTKYLGGAPKEIQPKPTTPILPPTVARKAPPPKPPQPEPEQKKQVAPQQTEKAIGLTPKMIADHLGKKPFVVVATAMEHKIFPTLNTVLSDEVIRAVYKDLKGQLPNQADLEALRSGKYERKTDHPKETTSDH